MQYLFPLIYLDPGSGSFLFQLLVAAAMGLGVTVIASWTKIKGWLGIKSKKNEEEDTETDDDESAAK